MFASSYPVLDAFLTILYFFLFIIWIWLLIMVFMDIFRSHDLGGLAKALWVIFIIILPFLGVFVYLIARGGKMHERAAQQAAAQQKAFDQYVKQAAGTPGADTASTAEQAGRPQVTGRPDRGRVRRPEGQDPGQLGAVRPSPRAARRWRRRTSKNPRKPPLRPNRGRAGPRATRCRSGSPPVSRKMSPHHCRGGRSPRSPSWWWWAASPSTWCSRAWPRSSTSFPKLTSLDPIWFTFAVLLQVAHFACTIALQRIALRTKAWFSVTTSQLSGNAISLIVPGGPPSARPPSSGCWRRPGTTRDRGGGLTAFSLLGIGGLLALPIFVLPAIIAGTRSRTACCTRRSSASRPSCCSPASARSVLTLDGPLRWAGRVVQAARNRLKRKAEPMTGLQDRLVYERNRIRDVLGRRWKAALLLSSGRLAFDFGTLLATIRATGVKPDPSLVLLAYAVAGLLAPIPITPGGLGIVEAGLSALLDPGGRAGRRRRRRHVGLPDHLVLAADRGGAVRLLRLPAAVREARAGRRGGRRRRAGPGGRLAGGAGSGRCDPARWLDRRRVLYVARRTNIASEVFSRRSRQMRECNSHV